MTASHVPLSIPQIITIYRQQYPEGLICTECGLLLTTRLASHAKSNLTEQDRLAYVCAACRSDAREQEGKSAATTLSFARSKELASARRLRPSLIMAAASETHDRDSRAFMESVAEAEVGGRFPCAHCGGSHFAKDCAYSPREAATVLTVRGGRHEGSGVSLIPRAESRSRSMWNIRASRQGRQPRIGFQARPVRRLSVDALARSRERIAKVHEINAARRQRQVPAHDL
jgi:hypothetical protein